MAKDINLLPVDLKAGKEAVKASRVLRRLLIGMGSVFLAVVVITGGFLVYLYTNLNSTRSREEGLKNQIQSLEGTEQKLVLIKDRIQKAQGVLSLRDSFKTLTRYDEIVTALPADATLSGLEVEGDISKLTVIAKNSDALAAIISSLKSKGFSSVELESLTFNSFSGYELIVSIN